MALTVNTGVPTVIEAGNNYSFTETFTEFPPTAWSMQFVMQIDGSSANTVNATNYGATNASFQVNFGTPTVPGHYQYAEYVTARDGSGRQTAKTGVLEVIPDLTQTQALSTAATMLANIESAITSLTSGGLQSVSVNNVSYTRYDLTTLIQMRTRLQAEVFREQEARDAFRGIETSGRIGTRFRPSPSGTPFFSKDIGE